MVPRARGRWRGSGWRRRGAGRYFQPQYVERPSRLDPRSDDRNADKSNSDILPPIASHASDALSKDFYALSVDEARQQDSGFENVASADTDRRFVKDFNVRDMRPGYGRARSRRYRPMYVVRRSSAGRYRDDGRAASRPTVPSQQAVTSATVPCSADMAEDWDAECIPLEPTDVLKPDTETETNMRETQTTENSAVIEREHDTDVSPANTCFS